MQGSKQTWFKKKKMLNDGGRLIGAKGKLSSRMAKCKFAQCAKKRKQNPAAATSILLCCCFGTRTNFPVL